MLSRLFDLDTLIRKDGLGAHRMSISRCDEVLLARHSEDVTSYRQPGPVFAIGSMLFRFGRDFYTFVAMYR